MSDTEIRDDRAAGRPAAVAGGEVAGRVEYVALEPPGRAPVPVRTVVEPAHERKGIAGSLARERYATARPGGVRVAPLCPYVVTWAERHPDRAPAADPALLRAAESRLTAHPDRF
ncbi:N-acetyltransferase [Streptomyces sp. NPDC051207]|uniref:GNAT family N-acetyltransferase n=1 Tax=Streptomyces sp. NPDC051207 TaxID=3154641 RepID=UPI00342E72BE